MIGWPSDSMSPTGHIHRPTIPQTPETPAAPAQSQLGLEGLPGRHGPALRAAGEQKDRG
jgi:hypothetical protein